MGLPILPRPLHLSCLLVLCSLPAGLGAATLPPGFAETQVATGLNPTTMSFAPDGRLFLCEKHGLLRVLLDGKLLPDPVLDLSAKIDAWNERGLLSICFDPDFSRNGWIYLYYTLNREPGKTSHDTSNNRVSRFTLKGNVADPKSEKVILELNPLSKTGWHNGGGLGFGKDGKLYVSTGENANGNYAQDSSNLLGKLLRIEKDGSIPKDNPHYKDFKDDNRAIVALGLRNPFSIAVQRKTGLLYLSMVGANFEQIEAYESGKAPEAVNYGWPGIDGLPRKDQQQPPGYRAPAYAYDHGRGDGVALCSGDFYEPSKPGADAFPAEYAGRFFFSDYKGWIKYIDPAHPETRSDFASKIDRPIDVDTAPDGSLWYIERAGKPGGSDESNSASSNGSLWRVRWTGGNSQRLKLAVAKQPGNARIGESLGVVTVELRDESGKIVSTANDTITLTLEGNGKLEGASKVAAVRGVATFPALSIGKPGRGYILRASGSGVESVSSAGFDIANQLGTPLITPPAGSFSGPVSVSISSPAPGAEIHFSTDGKEPDASSATYTKPIPITADQTIKAIALRKDAGNSEVASAVLKVSGNKAYGLDVRPAVRGIKLPASEAEGLPATLSGTGIFTDKNLGAKDGVIPYSLNTLAWADGAITRRWVILPESTWIGFSPKGEFTWPGGTVFVQHFDMVMNPHSGARRKLETRVLVLDASGSFGYGASYRWRADESDADLVDAGGAEEVLKMSPPRDQTWSYPARGLCFMCHTPNAGFVLGPKARQLNGDFAYPSGRSDNQLRTWSYLQMFGPGIEESAISSYPALAKIDDAKASLETRVRSYLDANCAHCHRPAGTGAQWDARFDTPLAQQNILNGELREAMGIVGAKVVVPGDPAKSMLHLRMSSTTPPQQMPPVGRSTVDTVALEAVEKWIRETGAAPEK